MAAKNSVEDNEKQNIVDNISNEVVQLDKLEILKAKMASKQKDTEMKIVAKKERSIKFGVVGSGQGGGNIASAMWNLGYPAVAINTTNVDLKLLNLPDANKLLLDNGFGGSAKELSIGAQTAEMHRDAITQFVTEKLGQSQMFLLTFSLGGGSGAGSSETLISILSEFGKPIIIITVLPMESDDAQTKNNSLETLSKLAKLVEQKVISNLIVVDNAKIEDIYQNVSQMDFFTTANKAIVEPIDAFNTLSCMSSTIKGIDTLELTKMLVDSEGLTTYGSITVDGNFADDTVIAEAIINNLSTNMLAGGFDIKQSKYVGVILAANKEVWAKIPSSAVNYGMAMINDQCGTPKGVFKGIYTIETDEPVMKIYSMFSGLGLPSSRVEQLKKDAKEHTLAIKAKEEKRNLNLQLDTGTNETVSAAQKIKEKIANKSSMFGKLVNSVVDRRK